MLKLAPDHVTFDLPAGGAFSPEDTTDLSAASLEMVPVHAVLYVRDRDGEAGRTETRTWAATPERAWAMMRAVARGPQPLPGWAGRVVEVIGITC